MTPPFDSSLLSGYLDGELDADEIALVERVLEEHPERLRELEALRHLQRSLAGLPTPQPTADPVAGVRARIEQSRPAVIRSTRHWWLPVTPFALAACLLLGVGWAMFGSKMKPSQLASDRADQPPSDFQPPEASPDPLEREVGDEQRSLARDAKPEQLAMPPSESTARSLRSRTDFRSPSLGVASEREEASPGAMGGRFGGMGPSSPDADGASPARQLSASPESADAKSFNFMPEIRSPFLAESLDATSSERLQLNRQNAIRLRYGVPQEEQAETVRWLRTVAPRELKELPPAGDVKRYWFLGHQQEQQELQAAIKKRLELTEGELKVVQSESEAEGSGQERPSGATVPPDDSLESNRLSAPDGQPTAIIIEMFAHPKK